MALITNSTKHSIDLIVPLAIGGYVLYDSYIKKGAGKDIKTALLMCAIVTVIAYVVTSQITRLIDDKQ